MHPILASLDKPQRILVAGAGGGFDVLSALPFFLALKGLGHSVHLASYSFSGVENLEPARVDRNLFAVQASTPKAHEYFPEKHLAEWLLQRGIDQPVYTFARTGVVPLVDGYTALARELDLDTILLVDGGMDSLLTGDEMGLGTPDEDATSLVAVWKTPVKNKALLCLGFGVDHFHGVSHGQVLRSMAELTRSDALLGALVLMQHMPEIRAFEEALQFLTERIPHRPSIVNHSLLAALKGEFGSQITIPGRSEAQVWINPLMAITWAFSLEAVVQRLQYAELISSSRTLQEVGAMIRGFQKGLLFRRPPEAIPI